ncbi:sugar transferase [Nesterenkonia lutea]|uniref:Exopolysaccharide biosynthesis polyprenyl glycosylphosphotransferase n=1 Tax=Nesterenkonia lutea TaxID=272919 RepID=A0ABR9JD75_9MICC|nr:sugar transferase [Nesterenkonia lutea]MBE1523766.1 exopolysaccharide biosynthesis polyprenyl glycosylphosphotransferase [Nesterenkonia lutea]
MTAPSGPASAREWHSGYGLRLFITDLIIIAGVLAAVHGILLTERHPLASTLGLGVLWIAVLSLGRSRDWKQIGSGFTEYRRVLVATFMTFGVFFVAVVIFDLDVPREHILVSLPVGGAGLVLGRHLWRRHLLDRWKHGEWTHRVVVVGDQRKVRRVVSAVEGSKTSTGAAVAATYTEGLARQDGGVPDPGRTVAKITDVVTRSAADLVMLTETDFLPPESVRELGWALEALDVNLVVVPSLSEVAGSRIQSHMVGGVPMFHVAYPRMTGMARVTKRAFDIVVSATALLMLAPALLVIGIWVRLDSPGPVIFKQERVGIDHSRFKMLKFRSMVVDAEKHLSMLQELSEGNGVLFKMRRDPRVTRVGAVLRRLSFDELPQFYNVLRGEMSVVGPRPPLPQEVEAYDDMAHRRLRVKPGITGLWQVAGRSDLSWEESVRLDLYYVENWTLTGDIVIVLRTAQAVFGGSGAY